MGKHELVSQNSLAPTAKVLAGWITGAGATAVLGLLAAVSGSVPADTVWGGAAVAVLAGAASWLKRNRRA